MRAGASEPRGVRDGFVSGIACVSNSSTPVTGTALGVGHSDDENNVAFLLKNNGIRKARQYTFASVLCISGVELGAESNLFQGSPDLGEKRISCFGTAFEIPIEGFVDLLLGLRLDANMFPLHLASRVRKGSSTSSQE